MTQKQSETTFQKPSLAECDAMDEISLLDLAVVMGNIESAFSTGKEDSRFTASPVWKTKLDSDDPVQRGQIEGLKMPLPKMFDRVCMKLTLGLGLQTRVVVEDKDDKITFTCYDYPTDAQHKMMAEEIGDFINYDWVWSCEMPERSIAIDAVYDKKGEYMMPAFSGGRAYCNPYHPSYTFILGALHDKYEGNFNSYEEKLASIMSAPEAYQPVAAVFEEPDHEAALKLATDSFLIEALAIAIQFAFTCHVMTNAAEYAAVLDVSEDEKTDKKIYSLRFDQV